MKASFRSSLLSAYYNSVTESPWMLWNDLFQRFVYRGIFFQDHFQLQALPMLQSSVLHRSPMDQCYFNQAATSTIFSKNFSTNFFFGLYFGLFRRLPIRGTIFSEALNSEDFLCNSVLWKQNSSIVRYFTKGTSVIRSPVMTKTGWLKCQWCGASPLLDDSPLLGCRGRIWETYIILTQMGCKSICDARVETTVSSLYIAAWPQPCCKGYNRRWHTLSTLNYLYRRSAYEV